MMTEKYQPLGKYIEQCNERNVDNVYGAEVLRGVNNEGNIFPSKANIIGVEFNTYRIAHKGYFIYNPARLDIGSLSCLQDDTAIFSQMYVVFKVKEEYNDILLTDYLWMWLKRKEFYRYVGFINFGSVREMFTYEDMCNVLLPIPPISEQRRIVSEYQTVERRIANNERLIKKLEETAQAIYHHTFVEGIDENNLPEGWRKGTIGDLGEVIGGATPSTEIPEYWVDNGISWLSPADMPRGVMYVDTTAKHITTEAYNSASTKMLPIGTVLFSSRAPIGLTAIAGIELCTNQGYKSVVPREDIGSYFVYYLLMREKDKIAGQQEGSTFAEISGKELSAYNVIIPPICKIEKFSKSVDTIAKYRHNLERETHHLRTLLSLSTSRIS